MFSRPIKITVFGLIIGSLLTPWYLLIMVGKYVDVNILETIQTIAFIILFTYVSRSYYLQIITEKIYDGAIPKENKT